MSTVTRNITAYQTGGQDQTLSDGRPLRVYTREQYSISAFETVSILDMPAGTAGTVEMIQFAVGGSSSLCRDSLLNVRVNRVGSPGESTDLGAFFHHHGTATSVDGTDSTHHSNVSGLTRNATTEFGAYRRVEIPFSDGIIIDVQNTTAQASAIYSQVMYRVGEKPNQSERRAVWKSTYTALVSVPEYGAINLCNLAGRGEIESVYLLGINGASSAGFLEGNVTWTLDGTAVTWGGTEDYFGGQFYWNNFITLIVTDFCGVVVNGVGPLYVGMWRYHRDGCERLLFDETATLTWHNGQSGQGTASGATSIIALVTYWLDTP